VQPPASAECRMTCSSRFEGEKKTAFNDAEPSQKPSVGRAANFREHSVAQSAEPLCEPRAAEFRRPVVITCTGEKPFPLSSGINRRSYNLRPKQVASGAHTIVPKEEGVDKWH
jgi:hypothetical protein